MCCIIYRIKDSKPISKENFDKIIKKNPHGWGISYLNDDGLLVVEKNMDMTLAYAKVKEIEDENKEFLFHARWATHGEKNQENCHPFPIHNGVMFHNGKMDSMKMWRKEMSDSWHFTFKVTKFIKKNRTLDDLVHNKFKTLVGESRLAFMLRDGSVERFGEWHEIEGSFYSKIDWKSYGSYTHVDYDNLYDYGHGSTKYHSNRNNTVKHLKSVRREAPFDKVSRDYKLEDIKEQVQTGDVKDEFIDFLGVDDITKLCLDYPETMANYMYELIHREEN